MATQPETQPVLTPAPVLSVALIREALNPAPKPDAPVGVVREWGYLDAMLDAALSGVSLDDDEELDNHYWMGVTLAVLDYTDCDWYTVEWDSDGVMNLLSIIDVLRESD